MGQAAMGCRHRRGQRRRQMASVGRSKNASRWRASAGVVSGTDGRFARVRRAVKPRSRVAAQNSAKLRGSACSEHRLHARLRSSGQQAGVGSLPNIALLKSHAHCLAIDKYASIWRMIRWWESGDRVELLARPDRVQSFMDHVYELAAYVYELAPSGEKLPPSAYGY
jgi:hypothetical protein